MHRFSLAAMALGTEIHSCFSLAPWKRGQDGLEIRGHLTGGRNRCAVEKYARDKRTAHYVHIYIFRAALCLNGNRNTRHFCPIWPRIAIEEDTYYGCFVRCFWDSLPEFFGFTVINDSILSLALYATMVVDTVLGNYYSERGNSNLDV